MELVVKFICSQHYDFERDGQRITGDNCYVYDYNSNNIIKVKIVDGSALMGVAFGDEISIHCIPNGRYLRYEV